MRGICLVLALLGVPAIAAAQYVAPVERGSVAASNSLPTLGLPLPSIGLPPRAPVDDRRPVNTGQQRSGHQQDWTQREFQQRDWQQNDFQQPGWQQRDGQQGNGQQGNGQWRGPGNPFRHERPGLGYIYIAPQYPYGYVGMPTAQQIMQATTVPGVITVVPEPLSGRLLLEVEPADILQVFVDGEYVGTPADLGSALDLRPGSRRIEFRAPGYKTLTIDAQIVSQRTIVYRATLDRIAPTRVVPPPAAPVAPPVPVPPPMPIGNRTMYLIPGCYMGNVPPQDLKLPAGCDLSRMTTIKP
jgi:hypothetical protein